MTTGDELTRDDIRDLPDTELQCGAVIGKASDQLADIPVCLDNLSRRDRWERLVYLDSEVDPVNREFSVAKCVWHVRIELGNDQSTIDTRPLNSGRKNVDLDSERDLAATGNRGVDEYGVDRP